MALVMINGPRGGAGTTFLAAHVAVGLAELGADVTLLTAGTADTAALHFGLVPATAIPPINAASEDALIVSAISLRRLRDGAGDPDLVPMLLELGYLAPGLERCVVVDVPAGDRALAARLAPHAAALVCPLTAAPDCIALLPALIGGTEAEQLERTFFVVNQLDETRRLARHGATFLRELLGVRLAARVRLDEAVPEAIAMLQPLAKYAPSSAALADVRAIAGTLLPNLSIPRPALPVIPRESRVA